MLVPVVALPERAVEALRWAFGLRREVAFPSPVLGNAVLVPEHDLLRGEDSDKGPLLWLKLLPMAIRWL